jgi:hypothetical protein
MRNGKERKEFIDSMELAMKRNEEESQKRFMLVRNRTGYQPHQINAES